MNHSGSRTQQMFTVQDSIWIAAPIERVFRLSTDISLVRRILRMRPVAGRTIGCVTSGDTVEWRGWKFCWPTRHLSLISAFEEPVYFQDRQLRGRFAWFEHDHHLRSERGGTLLEDEVRFALPFGVPGQLVGRWIVAPHVRRLLRERFALLQQMSEESEALPTSL